MADTMDSKSIEGNLMRVRLSPAAPKNSSKKEKKVFLLGSALTRGAAGLRLRQAGKNSFPPTPPFLFARLLDEWRGYTLLLTYFECLDKVYIIHFLLVGNNSIPYIIPI